MVMSIAFRSTTVLIIALLAFIYVQPGVAQTNASSVPTCGQTCVSNMKDKATEFGCPASDLNCLCQLPDYGYGVRDCVDESCPESDRALDFNLTAAFIVQECKEAGITGTNSSATTSASATSQASATEGASTTPSESSSNTQSAAGSASSTASSAGTSYRRGPEVGIGMGAVVGSLLLVAVGAL